MPVLLSAQHLLFLTQRASRCSPTLGSGIGTLLSRSAPVGLQRADRCAKFRMALSRAMAERNGSPRAFTFFKARPNSAQWESIPATVPALPGVECQRHRYGQGRCHSPPRRFTVPEAPAWRCWGPGQAQRQPLITRGSIGTRRLFRLPGLPSAPPWPRSIPRWMAVHASARVASFQHPAGLPYAGHAEAPRSPRAQFQAGAAVRRWFPAAHSTVRGIDRAGQAFSRRRLVVE